MQTTYSSKGDISHLHEGKKKDGNRYRGGAEGQRGGRRGPEGRYRALYRASWSTDHRQ